MANGNNTIGLCMIVKNEANLIRRCLASALPLVDYILVVDTGSTDGTQQIVCDFLDEHGVPGAVIDEPWRDFAYNRSFALQRLREVPGIDYALMLDADDVLVLAPGFDVNAFKAQMRHDHYDVLVDEGAVTHFRGHICSNRLPYAYKGVLHEYLDAPPGERGHTTAAGISIRASRGGARSQNPRKYHDDAAVLEEALATETDPGLVSRYTFYLAQSYHDAGRLADAAKAYAKRAEMGGWEEEAWHARLAQARCLRDLKDEGGFLGQALAAFSQRPHRAEPLYDLARYHRDRGRHEAAALFAERGLALGRPESDTLFVEDFVYQWGLQEEYSIAANYARDPARKDRGFAACNWLALNRDVPDAARSLARHNLRFYVDPAAKFLPSFAARPVGFTPPEGWHPMNPSVARRGNEIVMVQRTVNFVLEGGNYRTPGDGPVVTRNFLLRLDAALTVESSVEILPPIDLPPPRFGLVLGFEDMRLFGWQGALWCIAVLCELTPEGWRQQVLARIDESGAGPHRLVDWRVLEPTGPRRHEKNWMPLVEADPAATGGERLRFLYLCDPTRIVDDMARTVTGSIPAIAAEEFRGGSQAIEFAGGRLALVHEVGFSGADNKERLYHHRFVWFDDTYALRGVSRPFVFERPGVEFAAGLARHPDGQRLIISYGVGDGTAWLATVDAEDVRAALLDTARLPSAAPDDTAEAAERFLGAESLATPPAEGGQLSLHAAETVSVESPPEAEHEVAVEPETPLAPNPAAAVGPAPTEQDAPQTDQPPTLVLGSLGAEDFESQHPLRPARDLHARVGAYPRVLIAILAKQKERPLPLFLSCVEGLDYPKSAIFLYVRTNNNTDGTEQILRQWVERVGSSYAGVEFDAEPVEEPVEQFLPHEWNSTRFRVLGQIRNVSLQKTLEHGCDFYFVSDTDNFIRSCTLKELVALNLPIVAPFLRVTNPAHTYSNFFAKTDAAGFYAGSEEYQWITHRWVRGVVEVPVVHCTYLARKDVIPELHYLDGSDDWEFAVFCKSAREAGIPQYLDNRQVYGYITFDPESNATKVNVAGGESDQIGFARTELEKADGLNLPDTGQYNDSNGSTEEIRRRFTEISRRQLFGPGSGVGSAPEKTVEYRAFLQRFMARNRIRSVVDFGCGEWQFSQLVDWSGVRYVGVDVVPTVIEKNRRDFGSDTIGFETFESLATLPRADLLLCKDVLQHLPNSLVRKYLAAFRRKYKFLLITNDEEPAEFLNTDTEIGGWRTLRLDREPFREPGATVLSWPSPWAVGGTVKSTYLLYGDFAAPREITSRRASPASGGKGPPLKFLPAHFAELVRTFWRPNSAPPISAGSPDDVSIVSAFFDIGRADWSGEVNGVPIPAWQKRSTETYLARFDNLARLRNQMVIFTEERFAEAILEIRRKHGLEELTTILVCDDLLGENGQLADLYRSIERTMGSALHGLVHNPGYPEFWHPDYVLLMSLKPAFVCAALDLGLISHAQVAWVDFGYCRDDQRFDPAVPWRFDCRGRMNIFYVQAPDDRPIFDVIRSGAQYFQGCHLVGPAECWPRFRELMDEAWASLLACGLVHHDEPSILMAYRQAPELFLPHAVDPSDWFVLFQKFRQLEGNESRKRTIAPGPADDPSPEVDSSAEATDTLPPPTPLVAAAATRLIFIHSSWRTSSTWFWDKFRQFPQTACYYEPFNEDLLTITPDQAASAGYDSWDSRHPPGNPYYPQYLPLIQATGGVRSFDRSMSLDWFTPIGGLRGTLRHAELKYLNLLIDRACETGKIPVFGDTRSLGRLWPVKNSFGGLHVFLHRNLWKQWLSYLYYARRGMRYFGETTARVVAGSEDHFLAAIADFYIKRALGFRSCRDGGEHQPPSDNERLRLLHSLPESDAFAMFMALHVYLYLHAQLAADLTIDVTELARDSGYRSRIENELTRQTGLEISFSDIADRQPATSVAIGAAAIDWEQILQHAHAAVQTLSAYADPTDLMQDATAFIDAAIAEVHKSEAELAKREDAAEEIWWARLQNARCHWALGDDSGFLRQALELHEDRPDRAEALFDLSRFHRERGMHETAADYAEAGLALERPANDAEFVDHLVYQYGLQEELSIAAFYCCRAARQDRGFAACNWLALNRDIPEDTRNMARGHLRFYVGPASKLMPSFTARPLGFTPPEGWHSMSASLTRQGDEIVMVQCAVNPMRETGDYWTPDGAPITARNFMLRVNMALAVESSVELLPPVDLPATVCGFAQGLEDLRIFTWGGSLWCTASEREPSQEGGCRQMLGRIDEPAEGPCRLADWCVLGSDEPRRNENNWMPLVEPAAAQGSGPSPAQGQAPAGSERLRFISLCDPTRLIDGTASVIAETTPPIAAEQFRGGTQAIEFDGGWLALVHEEVLGDTPTDRANHHRFIWFDKSCALRSVSRPFYLQEHDEEVAAGLAWHPDSRRLIISYATGGGESWIATVDAAEVRAALEDAERLPSGVDGRSVVTPVLPHLARDATTFAFERRGAPRAPSALPIHVINLDRTPRRLAEFQRRNAHLSNVERFRAVDGRTLDREKLIKDGVITADCIYTAGNVGCAISHFTLWRKAVEEDRPITVAEDDAIFSQNFAGRSREFLEGLPKDWDFVQWGWVFQQRVWVQTIPQILNTTMIFDQDQLRRHIDDFQSHDLAPTPLRLGHSFGTVCYSVSPKGARALLEHCTPLSGKLIEFPGFGVVIENKGIDCMMNGVYPSLKAFISVPPLAVTEHREEETTTREGGVDRFHFTPPQAEHERAERVVS
jgi:protein YibB